MSSQLREIYGVEFPLINRYVDILASTAVEWGLIGPREAERLWDRHILNSAALSGLIAADSTVADVGSGAGLPGIPLALGLLLTFGMAGVTYGKLSQASA